MKQSDVFRISRKKEMVARTFHLENEQLEPLQQVAGQMGISQSEMVRRSINLFIERYRRIATRQERQKPDNA